MGTKWPGQRGINEGVRQPGGSPSNDVWVSQNTVIEEWGFGEEDLWVRLVDRHNELLETGGVQTKLWRTLDTGLPCTCTKDETGQPEARCQVCFGTNTVGGYERFGFSTILIASNTPGVTLTDAVVVNKQPDQFEIAPGKTVGTILSPKFQITQSFGYDSSLFYGFDGIRQLTTKGITVEFTTNDGVTFENLFSGDTSALTDPALNVQFRITLTRSDPKASSPFFQILRARWQMSGATQVLISKRSFPEQRWLETFGVRVKLDGITWWTTPNLGIDGQLAVFLEEDDLFEIEEGAYRPQTLDQEEFPVSGRFKPTNVTYVEPKGRFLSQRFNIRMLQRDEPELAVF